MGDCVMRIPLHAADGSVRRWALVDAEDYEHLRQWHWNSNGRNGRYPSRSAYLGKIDGRYRRRYVAIHRVVMGLEHGDPRRVDHVNRDPFDCRKSNLRFATQAQNCQNVGAYASGASRYRGVSLHKAGKYVAQAQLNGRKYYLGLFEDEEEAARVAADWRREHMPFAGESAP